MKNTPAGSPVGDICREVNNNGNENHAADNSGRNNVEEPYQVSAAHHGL